MEPKKFYIIRPEIEIEYIKNPILGRLYIMLNYWRFIKAGYYWIFTYKVYYIACDIVGDVHKWVVARLVDGEIQIVPNNNAAIHKTDLGANSKA